MVNTDIDLLLLFLFFVFFFVAAGTVFTFVPSLPMRILNVMSPVTVVAQWANARLFEREVSGSIFSDFNVCFDFPLICVAIALNTRKMEH